MLHGVKQIAKASDNTYGSRRMKKALGALGYVVSRNKARKLMREMRPRVWTAGMGGALMGVMNYEG